MTAQDPNALTQAASALLQRGQPDAARACALEALRAAPGHLGALNLLGISLNRLGQHARAIQVFDELARRDPRHANHWMNLGTALQAERRHDDALAAYARAAALGEASADFFYNVGLVHVDRGNFEAALAVLKDAVRLAPDDAEICYQYAVCCDATMDQPEAVRILSGWPKFKGLSTELLAKIGMLLMNLGEAQIAKRAIDLALADPQPDLPALLQTTQILERMNRLPEARAALAKLKSSPNPGALRGDLRLVEARLAERDGRFAEACDTYRAILKATPEFRLRHFHLFPLAKALDALGRHEDAFAALQEAHQSQIAYMQGAAPGLFPKGGPPIKAADHACSADDVAAWDEAGAPSTEESPVFIVGFPRSGTTLLEQALDANPALRSMDETYYLHELIDRMVESGIDFPGRLAALTPQQAADLRAYYWSQVRRKVDLAPGQRLLDKNPMNLMGLQAIRRLFPNARILLAVRHPCDVILSCYMQHFRAFQFTYLCRDLETLATGYRRAFDFWYRESALLKPAAFESRYETLVSDFEPQVRRVAEFLELPWTDAMLEPGAHASRKGFISTPSYTQVVQPVNTRAVGRWEAYERHFAPVLPILQPYFDRWGYGAGGKTR